MVILVYPLDAMLVEKAMQVIYKEWETWCFLCIDNHNYITMCSISYKIVRVSLCWVVLMVTVSKLVKHNQNNISHVDQKKLV